MFKSQKNTLVHYYLINYFIINNLLLAIPAVRAVTTKLKSWLFTRARSTTCIQFIPMCLNKVVLHAVNIVVSNVITTCYAHEYCNNIVDNFVAGCGATCSCVLLSIFPVL